MTGFETNYVSLETSGAKSFKLKEELVYEGENEMWLVPSGFETDFATVPRVIQWLIPTYGLYTLAAILHDFFCVELGKAHRQRRTPFISSSDADGVFRRVMRELGVPFTQRWLIWAGVRWGALFNKARRQFTVKDVFKMIVVSVLSAPLVVPVSLLVAAGLVIAWIINIAFSVFK